MKDIIKYFKRKRETDNTPNIEFNGFSAMVSSNLTKDSFDLLVKSQNRFSIIAFDNYYEEQPFDFVVLNKFFEFHPEKVFSASKPNMLKRLNNVQKISLSLHDEEDWTIFEELYELRKVVSLELGHFFKKYDISRILDFKETLEHLSYEKDARKGSEKIIKQLTKLKSISLTSVKFENFNFLSHLPLENFYLYGSRTLNWDGLEKITTMKNFTLKNNPKWDNFDFLNAYINLEELRLHYVKNHSNRPNLEHLKKLKFIEEFK